MTWRILLIDDDEDDYVLTRDMVAEFEQENVVLDWVASADAGASLMQLQDHDAYLIDFRMGALDGLTLVRDAIEAGNQRPMILMTGQGDRAVDMLAMEAGAADYLVKGTFDAPVLERSIRYAIRHKSVEAELAEMQRRLADSREEERLYFAQELHDGALQDLIGAQYHLSVVAQHAHTPLHDELSLVQTQLTEVIATLRTLCTELRPPALAPFGLEQAIRAHAGRFQSEHPEIAVALELDADGQALPEHTRLALFRIFQHALSNVAEHADATQVRVSFQLRAGSVHLRVMDDGRGFRMPARWIEFAREGHLGLLGASERAAAIGGHMVVHSSPDAGTTLAVTAPLAARVPVRAGPPTTV